MDAAAARPGPAAGQAGGSRESATNSGAVVAGLAAGVRHVSQRRPAAAALAATGSHRFLYGILLLMSILLYRNYFYRATATRRSATSPCW